MTTTTTRKQINIKKNTRDKSLFYLIYISRDSGVLTKSCIEKPRDGRCGGGWRQLVQVKHPTKPCVGGQVNSGETKYVHNQAG